MFRQILFSHAWRMLPKSHMPVPACSASSYIYFQANKTVFGSSHRERDIICCTAPKGKKEDIRRVVLKPVELSYFQLMNRDVVWSPYPDFLFPITLVQHPQRAWDQFQERTDETAQPDKDKSSFTPNANYSKYTFHRPLGCSKV